MAVSIVVNYYNNQRCLEPLLANYKKLSAIAKDFFELVLVDDHSHEPPDLRIFENVAQLRVFRVTEDIPWNMPGARNIGALEARNRLILFSDVDHILEVDQLHAFIEDSQKIQVGTRVVGSRKPLGSRHLHPHVNCFLMYKQDFFKVGGYEELFSGHYGQEDKFFRYCCRYNGVEDEESEFKLTAIAGGATKKMNRDKTRNELVIETLIAASTIKARKAFQFAYEQIV
jgi:glycosyltransferase involved in cell wall biosynthesis